MRKLMALVLTVCMLVSLAAVSLAEDGAETVEWTSDLPPISEADERFLILANADEPLSADYVPEDLQNVQGRTVDANGYSTSGTSINLAASVRLKLVGQAISAMSNLTEAAAIAEYKVFVRAGYRSYKDQEKRLARAKAGENIQKAGECDYQTGLAVTVVSEAWRGAELTTEFAQTDEYKWLETNCVRYGFIIRYPEGGEDATGNAFEPWHLRYIGSVKAAAYIMSRHITLEEFVARYREAKADFLARGGSIDILLDSQKLPEGPVVTTTVGEDGDAEIILFHD